MKHTPGPMNKAKNFYVSWEGYTHGSQPEGRHELDRCCLQGPHDYETAVQIAAEIRSCGSLASVIDCSKSLRNTPLYDSAPELLEALIKLTELTNHLANSNHAAPPITSAIEAAYHAIKKARGEL